MDSDFNFLQNMTVASKTGLAGLCWITLYGLVRGDTLDDCEYLDLSKSQRTSVLQCSRYGCCGDFKARHCCTGPFAIVGGVFGGILLFLIVAIVVGILCNKYKSQNAVRQIPTISARTYNEIPEPTPPLPTPRVYNPSRLHPPPFRKVPQKPGTSKCDNDVMSSDSSSSQSITELLDSAEQLTKSEEIRTAKRNIKQIAPHLHILPSGTNSSGNNEIHPPPSILHLPRFTRPRR
ncbi:uncharacterized protein LOC127860217 [Dreissena polymorpha]|nr:uncharacterized protein LOC127860217 [Dreissena polymorpha]